MNTPAITPATAIIADQNHSDSWPMIPWSMASRVSAGTATLPAPHSRPANDAERQAAALRPSTERSSGQPLRPCRRRGTEHVVVLAHGHRHGRRM